MNDDMSRENIAQTTQKIIENHTTPKEVVGGNGITEPRLFSIPKDHRIENVSAVLAKANQYFAPHRKKGEAKFTRLESLIEWTQRYKTDDTVIFAEDDRDEPTLTAVINYHSPCDASTEFSHCKPDEAARHCDHKGSYSFPMSDQWIAWNETSGKYIEKDELGEFIEKNALDVLDPTPALLDPNKTELESWEKEIRNTLSRINGKITSLNYLLEMSKSFQVYESSNLEVRTNRDSGEQTINFVNEHKDSEGKPLSIPNLFLIAIPIFNGGDLWRIPVRFRYRKSGASIKFMIELCDSEKSFDAAFEESVNKMTEKTNLNVFYGCPESQ